MTDAEAMDQALALAGVAVGRTAPNPPVGAVLVRDGVILGRGYTRPAGGPHAEVEALADAAARGADVRGATMVVTLEPCCHHGRTPPCTDAILAAGIGRVVVGVVDPFPAVRGRGIAQLRAAGVEVEVGVAAARCAAVMRGFLRVTRGGLPEVSLKAAISLDGAIAAADGSARWITGEAARAHGHGLRARHDAILVGRGTVEADDPRLTCRVADGCDPVPVVLWSDGRLPPDARLLYGPRRAVIVCGHDAELDRGLPADVVRVGGGPGGLDVRAALRELGARGLHRVLVEGGGAVHRSLLDADVVDAVYLYVAGVLLPGGRPWVGGPAVPRLADARRFGSPEVTALGSDVLLHYAVARADDPTGSAQEAS